ncbi:lipopolysaccharide biosynthesis protein [Gordonibacter massiliensis (ex Traore et al. 2017)]|uniref:Oligosaccharide flippase family protein n=1 Tax=Gordonibacter massiliensis (ex Traore et al. 2017) TaxID=1841863 RepID=A0A842JJJ0_9ACTN|nr:oligosaccharide flippase family protein [Gordonibacter massiliensis (ex Traore et al. 2017)]MBC2889905.1 oligosaccharide flippase family protein [Gordonibacter massiliensis (ex Traore et al. 2017)]
MAVSQYKLGALLSYTTMGFNALAGLLYTPWMVSCIGATDYGLYTLALSVVNMFLLDFGLSQAVTRFLARYYAREDKRSVPMFLGVVYKLYFILAIVIAAVFAAIYLNADLLYANLSQGELDTFKNLFAVAALYSCFLMPCMPFEGILVARERFIALNICTLVYRVLLVAGIVVALLNGMGVFALVVVNACMGVLYAAAKYIIIKKCTGDRADILSWNGDIAREMLGFSVWQAITQSTEQVSSVIMPSILAITSGSVAVAVFGLASMINGYVYEISNVLRKMLYSSIARMLQESDARIKLQNQSIQVGKLQLALTGFFLVGFIAVGDRFVSCWMGPGYPTLSLCCILIIAANVFRMPQCVGDNALTLEGYVKQKALLGIFQMVLVVIFGTMLSWTFGLVGGCVAVFLAGFLRAIGLQYLINRYLGIDARMFFAGTFVPWLLPAVISGAGGLAISHIVPLSGWSGFIVCGLGTFLLYALLSLVFSWKGNDRDRLLRQLGLMSKRPVGRE